MKHYETKDLYEASAISLQEQIISLEEVNDHYVFVFNDQARKIADMYWSNKLTGNIFEYAQCVRNLKDRIFSKIRCK